MKSFASKLTTHRSRGLVAGFSRIKSKNQIKPPKNQNQNLEKKHQDPLENWRDGTASALGHVPELGRTPE